MLPVLAVVAVGSVTLAGVVRRWGSVLVAVAAVGAMLGLSVIFAGYRNVAALGVAWVLGFVVPELPGVRAWPWWAQVLVAVAAATTVTAIAVLVLTFAPPLLPPSDGDGARY